jgi:hypothetical protein
LDTLATNDHAVLRVARVAADAADTLTGDCILLHISVSA